MLLLGYSLILDALPKSIGDIAFVSDKADQDLFKIPNDLISFTSFSAGVCFKKNYPHLVIHF